MILVSSRFRSSMLALAMALFLALVTGCAPSEFRPVHDDVSWEGENVGSHEDDPRIQALRQYLVQKHAADNALNYSSPDFTETTTDSSRRSAISAARYAVDKRELRMWEGPPIFTVMKIRKFGDSEQTFEIVGCEKHSPWWSKSTDRAEVNDLIESRDNLYYVTPQEFHMKTYNFIKKDGHWRLNGGSSPSADCTPEAEFAIGTYTTPPDLDLLHRATSENVIAVDHRGRG